MARGSRLDAPGSLHHVIVRSIERREIFRDDRDREDFLTRLGKVVQEGEASCLAWVLIPNHAHFLLRTGSMPLARMMRRLLTGYAVRFNLRHQRSGHLFQNRYKSVVCEEDSYLLELVRYIHLNGFRAGLVKGMGRLLLLWELQSKPVHGQTVSGRESTHLPETEAGEEKQRLSPVSKSIPL